MFKDRIFSNKSTASRELGKLEIPRELRNDLIVGDVAPFTIDEKLLKKVLADIKGEVIEPSAELVEQAVAKELAKKKPSKATKEELDHLFGKDKPAKVVKNGKTYPMKGVCKAIWDECEKFYADNKETPTPAQMQEIGNAKGWHKVTVYRQFNDWKKFKGL